MPRESQPATYETPAAPTSVPDDWLAGEDESWADDYGQSEAEKAAGALSLWRVGVLSALIGGALWAGVIFLVYQAVLS